MTDKLKRHIQDTAQTLQLSGDQAEYLKNCMHIAYMLGSKDGLQEGMDIATKHFNIQTDKELQKV